MRNLSGRIPLRILAAQLWVMADFAEQVVFDAVGRVDVEIARVAAALLTSEMLAHGQIRAGRLLDRMPSW